MPPHDREDPILPAQYAPSPPFARRAVLGGIGAVALAAGMEGIGAAGPTAGQATDSPLPDAARWPSWAPTADAARQKLATLRTKAVSLRQFGAALDGMTDDTPAFTRALAAGVRAVLVEGPARLTRSLAVNRPFAVFGSGKGPHLIWDGRPLDPIFAARPASADPTSFVRDVAFSGLHVVRAEGQTPGGVLVRAINIRGLTVVDCRTERTSLAFVTHARMATYDRTKGSETVDPAVLAGFSATDVDDLNEDITVLGNQVDFGMYMGDVLRFNFARRVVAQGNKGRFARISWWGGGAKRLEGGMPQFLRRVRDAYIADNAICNVNGGIYGNNGQSIAVVRNTVWDTNDVGIDFEGCIDCIATLNHCRNAGNFVYAAFYVARNVRFVGNYGEQDGSAASIDTRLGSQPIGTPRGLYLAALRGAGFAGTPGAIDVTFADNTFVYSGKQGLGRILPGPFNRLTLTGNTMRNVACDIRDRGGQSAIVAGNRLSFDHSARNPVTLLAASAPQTRMTGNVLAISARQPTGSAAIGYDSLRAPLDVVVTGNSVTGPQPLPLVVTTPDASGATAPLLRDLAGAIPGMTLAGNKGTRLYAGNPPPDGQKAPPFTE